MQFLFSFKSVCVKARFFCTSFDKSKNVVKNIKKIEVPSLVPISNIFDLEIFISQQMQSYNKIRFLRYCNLLKHSNRLKACFNPIGFVVCFMFFRYYNMSKQLNSLNVFYVFYLKEWFSAVRRPRVNIYDLFEKILVFSTDNNNFVFSCLKGMTVTDYDFSNDSAVESKEIVTNNAIDNLIFDNLVVSPYFLFVFVEKEETFASELSLYFNKTTRLLFKELLEYLNFCSVIYGAVIFTKWISDPQIFCRTIIDNGFYRNTNRKLNIYHLSPLYYHKYCLIFVINKKYEKPNF